MTPLTESELLSGYRKGLAEREGALHRLIASYCLKRGWPCFRGVTGKRSWRTKSEPDFHIMANGGNKFTIEVKSKTGKRDEGQEKVAKRAEELGHKIYLVRSLDGFLAMLKEYEL